jgi:murein DD-endopeptidase MepM/ murein hydrolase activator NlpD
MLGACVPPSAPAMRETPPPPVTVTIATPPPLELDLSGLRDRPAWEKRPVVANARIENGKRVHIVAAGETGIAIARAYGVPWSDIVTANALSEPFVIRVGQRLVLPGETSAKPRDTLEARAAAFRIGIDDIVTGSEPARTSAAPTKPVVRPATTPTTTARFAWPASGPVTGRFGRQGSRVSQGIDIDAPAGTAIRAASAGIVAYVGSGVPGFGGLILVRHEGGWISAYGRIASSVVAKDTVVKAGETLGRTGGDTLHFQLRRARVPVDPLGYLPKR